MEQNRLAGLQVARACAALSIAYFHSKTATAAFPKDTAYPIDIMMQWGWIAVDFFFLISGYVVCLVASKSNFDPVNFIIKRAFRIYPLWIATALFYLWFSGDKWTGGDLFVSLSLLPTEGYPLYAIGWSLQHEFAFYLLAAAIVPTFGLVGLAAFLVAGSVAYHAVSLPWYLHNFAFYYPLFLTGMIAFAVGRYLRWAGFVVPLVAGTALLWFFSLHYGRTAYPAALFFWLIAFLNLRASPDGFGVLLGDASYSIYLIHPLVFFCTMVFTQLHPLPIYSQELLRYGGLVAIVMVSIASWKWFEMPLNKLATRIPHQRHRVFPSGELAHVPRRQD